MRFEIGPGGGIVILVGLLGLSAGVFFLGMVSGREMAQSEVSQSQLATAFPMPAVPTVAPSPAAVAAATPAALAPPEPAARAALTSAGSVTKPAPEHAAATERAAQPKRVIASAPPPRHAVPASTAETGEPVAGSSAPSTQPSAGQESVSAPPPPQEHNRSYSAAHRRGYNIVIDAAMDRQGANRMAARLLALGFTPSIVPTTINGQMWYKVQVGPYPSEDDARAAQVQLRAAYTARYVNRSSAAAGGAGTADPTR
jgi:septal ring-binding cell division protein DamX